MLKYARGEYVSSRTICETFQTSRTAIWKHVQSLQKQGYSVEAVPSKGYRLLETDDFVSAYEIKDYIQAKVFGKLIAYRESVDSTNSAARQLADQGEPEGTLVIADEQTHGRGRFQRKWYSPAKSGIWMSLILRPNLSIVEAPRLTVLTAVAVAKTLTKLSNQQAYIKWPNDILFDGKKVCGILTEINVEGNQINYVIVGIGINVNLRQDELPISLQPSVCSLQSFVHQPLKRARVVANILSTLEDLYITCLKSGDFTGVMNYFKIHNVTLGHVVEIQSGSSRLAGIVEDIDDYGALVIRTTDHQIKKIYSGDILSSSVQ